MMHPDQLFSVRQLQHQDLLAEAEQARRERDGGPAARARTLLATWLERVGVRWMRGALGAGAPEGGPAS